LGISSEYQKERQGRIDEIISPIKSLVREFEDEMRNFKKLLEKWKSSQYVLGDAAMISLLERVVKKNFEQSLRIEALNRSVTRVANRISE
jgi:hypothetical protein